MLQCSIVSSHFFVLDRRQLLLLYVSLTVGQLTLILSLANSETKQWRGFGHGQNSKTRHEKQSDKNSLLFSFWSAIVALVLYHLGVGNRYRTMTPSSPIAKKTFVCDQLTALAIIAIAIATALDVPWNKPQTIDFRSRQDHKTGALKQQTQSSPYTGTELENLIPKINVSRVYILDSQAWYLWNFRIPGYTQLIINCLQKSS